MRVSISSLALCPSLELLTRFKYNIGFNLQKALGQSILIVLAFLQHAQKPLRRGKHPMKRVTHFMNKIEWTTEGSNDLEIRREELNEFIRENLGKVREF